MPETPIHHAVREKYGDIAKSVGKAGCCGATAGVCGDPITSNLYSEAEKASQPADAVAASLGCGNPTATLPLEAGQTVLDLGSGGGIDVLLSAKRVGPTVDGRFASAFIRARKPDAVACCGPECCA
jgi:arsenite methyltransferase